MKLRDYQADILKQVWSADSNDLVQLDTGAGKTPIEAALAERAGHCLLVAHRITLIRQISEKLAAFELEHDTISTEATRRRCMAAHRPHGRHYIRRGHPARLVVSIDSLIAQLRRDALVIDRHAPWLVIIDEAHHVVPDNKWGQLRELLPNARIIGFTATPARMDGESLHVLNGGLFDRLVQANGLGNDSAHTLIERGYLSDFIVYAPPVPLTQDKALEHDTRSAMSYDDFARAMVDDMTAQRDRIYDESGKHWTHQAPQALDYESGEVRLWGDPVREYRRRADGTRAIMMCPSIENAEQFARDFRAAGISASAIHSRMPQSRINRALDAFQRDEVRVICNVDMIGEGFDMPAVTTLIIATLTKSFPRYRQWVGRVLRPSPGKPRAIIIDLTRQVEAHGDPDAAVDWNLLDPPCGPKEPIRAPCNECGAYYRIKFTHCPECGAENVILKREPLGNYVFDIKILGSELIAQARRPVDEQKRLQRRRDEVIWPSLSDAPGIIGKTVRELRSWYVARLDEAGVPREQINDFLESRHATDPQFWMAHFTARDTQTRGTRKPKQVHRKWHSSR